MYSINLRRGLVVLLMAITLLQARGQAASSPSQAIQRGRTFLVELLDPNLDLLPEYHGAKIYWLFHDNYLAAKTLAITHPKTAQRILAAIHREGIDKCGNIEALFGEAKEALPFHQPELTDVRRVGDKVIRTEKVTGRVIEGWENYADLLLMASIAERRQSEARKHWEAAMRLWDGKGFLDAAAKHDGRYATYKLGLALVAASRLLPPAEPPQGLTERLLALQDDSGGWITDYDATGKKIGVSNVETTCIVILGVEARNQQKQPAP